MCNLTLQKLYLVTWSHLFTLLLIFDAVPNSSANILATREIWSFGGMIREIMLVPFLRTRYNMSKKYTEYWISINACNLQWIYRSTKRHQNDIKMLSNSKQGCSLQSHLPKGLDSSRYATNLRKYITFFKDMFGKFFCHLQFWFIQSTKLTLKCVTKCWLDKTNNRNRSMNAITRKVSNQHDKVED